MKKLTCLIIFLLQFTLSVSAQSAFVVNKIEIQGLEYFSPATVKSYVPVKPGQVLGPEKTGEILKKLYATGFFDRITLSREGNTLIIHVIERPVIGQLKITGNSVIPTDKLTTVMKTLDVAEGRIYNVVILEKIKQSLLNQYYLLGRYNARVDITTSPMSRHRVRVTIAISEGLVAKVRGISIIGNQVFNEKTLINQIDVSESGLFSFFTQSDRYSEEKLEASLEKLRNYYLDHGYLHFEIKSSQAQISPDRKSVYINVVVSEGLPYTVSGYEIKGRTILPKEKLAEYIHIKPGDVFSRAKVMDAQKAMTDAIGDKGYLFATVSILPKINEATRTVQLIFEVTPGKRVYVRQVAFSDNNRTNDIVLRREIEQMEGAVASTSKLEESKHRLILLPFIKDADMSVKPVPGRDDQVDVDYKIKEDDGAASAQATAKVGYSQTYGIIFGAGLNHKNFLGTGNTLGLNFSRSRIEQNYGIDYTDPYYTQDGISRTFSLNASRTDPGRVKDVNNAYTMNEYDAAVLFGIPLGQEKGVYNRLQMGAGYQNILIHLNNGASNQVLSYINNHGRHFQEIDWKIGLSRESRDKAIFPTSGGLQTLFVDLYSPVTSNSVSFYAVNYHGKWYQPLADPFILLTRADLGYGTGFHGAKNFPFFKNYYAGGIESVHGYQGMTLGPRDSNGLAYGGNMLVDASIGLIFKNYISDNLRTTLFVDGGNVYSSTSNHRFGCNPRNSRVCSTNSGPLRYSTGIEADWLTPLGPIGVSLAKPINSRKGDNIEIFQLVLGTNF